MKPKLFTMKTLNILILLTSFIVLACSSGKKSAEEATTEVVEVKPAMNLVKKWETDSTLTTVESVIYDGERGVIYASCISGTPDEKDGVGFIAQLDKEGNIIDNEWITGLDAPKGMAIVDNSLFVTDIDEVVEIDIENGEILMTYPVENAKFLNDAASDESGVVYFSDTGGGQLVYIENGEVAVFKDSVSSPNGLFVDGNSLVTAYWDEQKIKTIDMESGEITEMAMGIENPDGVEAIGDGGYLVSSWNGKVSYVSPEGEVVLLLDTSGDEINAADIEFIPEENILLVPTFFDNRVVAYELVME